MSRALVRRLSHRIHYETENFRDRLARLDAESFPSPAARAVIAQFHARLSALKRDILGLMHEYDRGNIDNAPLLDKLRSALSNIHSWLPMIRHLQRATTRNIPWSLVGTLEQMNTSLAPDRSLLVCSSEDAVHSIDWKLLDDRRILFIPELLRTDALWHTWVGHELCHPIANAYLSRRAAESIRRLQARCDEIEQDAVSAAAGPLFMEHKRRINLSNTYRAWSKGLEELLCDVGMVLLFGPAALLAGYSLAATESLDVLPSNGNDFYPSWRLRWRVMLSQHDEHGYLRLGDQIKATRRERAIEMYGTASLTLLEMKQASLLQDDQRMIDGDAFLRAAYKQVLEDLDEGIQHMRAAMPESLATWSTSREQVPALLTRLLMKAPPNEVPLQEAGVAATEPAKLPALLTAAWMYESYYQSVRGTEVASQLLSYDDLSRLVLKAIEDVETTTAWTRGQGEEGR